MGNEFFNRKKGAIRKCREQQKEKLTNELTPIVTEVQVISINVENGESFCKDHKFEVSLDNGKVSAYRDRVFIGVSEDVSPKLTGDIQETGGSVIGEFDRFRPRSKKLDLSISVRKNK